MASEVSLSSVSVRKVHALPQARHLNCAFCISIANLAFWNLPVLSCLKANCSISCSTCWSSPSFILTFEMVFRCSFSAASDAAASIASAKAHSCIGKRTFMGNLRVLC